MSLNVSEAVEYLRSRGFSVGEYASFPSELRLRVNGGFLTKYEVSVLAFYESCKDEDAAPDGLELQYMAEACLRISEHPSLPLLVAGEGRDLGRRFDDWKNSDLDYPIAQLRALCKRMAHFLTSWFGYLWYEEHAATRKTELLSSGSVAGSALRVEG